MQNVCQIIPTYTEQEEFHCAYVHRQLADCRFACKEHFQDMMEWAMMQFARRPTFKERLEESQDTKSQCLFFLLSKKDVYFQQNDPAHRR